MKKEIFDKIKECNNLLFTIYLYIFFDLKHTNNSFFFNSTDKIKIKAKGIEREKPIYGTNP